MKNFALTIGAALAAAGLMTAPANAAGVKVGTLTCNVASGWGYVLGSQKDVNCVFQSRNGAVERYSGEITKIGVDIGYTRGGVLIWAVVAPAKELKPDALEGAYGGVTAGATAVVGGSANALVGGFDKSIALQPLSIEGNTGLNIAAGVAGLQLKQAPTD